MKNEETINEILNLLKIQATELDKKMLDLIIQTKINNEKLIMINELATI